VEFLTAYQPTILVFGLTGLLMWVQLAIYDVHAIKSKHTPGFAVEQSHGDLLFRLNRAFANSNETVAIFILFALFGMLSNAIPEWLNYSAIAYFAGRVGHMISYYLNYCLLRSISFGCSFIALLSLFLAAATSWLS